MQLAQSPPQALCGQTGSHTAAPECHSRSGETVLLCLLSVYRRQATGLCPGSLFSALTGQRDPQNRLLAFQTEDSFKIRTSSATFSFARSGKPTQDIVKNTRYEAEDVLQLAEYLPNTQKTLGSRPGTA